MIEKIFWAILAVVSGRNESVRYSKLQERLKITYEIYQQTIRQYY